MATQENILIRFDVDTKELDNTITVLQKLGKITDEDAKILQHSNAEFAKAKEAIKAVGDQSKQTTTDITALSEANKRATTVITEQAKATEKPLNAFQALRKEIKGYASQLLEAEAAGDKVKFEQLKKKAGEAKDRLNDLNQTIKNVASDTRGFDAAIEGARAITAGFAIAQGATALFGDENKDLQKTLLKVQGAMALLNGLQEIQTVLQKESALALELKAAKTTLLTGVTEGMTAAEVVATVVTNGLNAAVKALAGPIGWIIGAVGLAASAYAYFAGKTKDAADEQERLKKIQEEGAEATIFRLKLLDQAGKDEVKLAKARGASEREQNEIEEANIKKQIGRLQAKDKSGEDLTVKEIERLTALQNARSDLSVKETDLIRSTEEKDKQEREKAQKDRLDQIKKHEDEALAARKKADENQIKRVDQITDVIADRAIEDDKKEEERKNNQIARSLAASNTIVANDKIAQNRKIQDEADYQAKLKLLKDSGLQAGQKISDSFFQIQKNGRDADTQNAIDNAETKKNSEIKNLDEQLKKKQISQEQYDRRRKQAEDRANKEEGKIKKAAFEANKQAAILQAIINAALAISRAFVDYEYPASVAVAALAGVEAAAQIAVIQSQPTPRFAKGVIDLRGPGTETSDSITAFLSKGESVMTAQETRTFRPTLMAIREGKVSHSLLNDISLGNIDPAFMGGGHRVDVELNPYDLQRAMKNNPVVIANAEQLAASIANKISNRGHKNFFS